MLCVYVIHVTSSCNVLCMNLTHLSIVHFLYILYKYLFMSCSNVFLLYFIYTTLNKMSCYVICYVILLNKMETTTQNTSNLVKHTLWSVIFHHLDFNSCLRYCSRGNNNHMHGQFLFPLPYNHLSLFIY